MALLVYKGGEPCDVVVCRIREKVGCFSKSGMDGALMQLYPACLIHPDRFRKENWPFCEFDMGRRHVVSQFLYVGSVVFSINTTWKFGTVLSMFLLSSSFSCARVTFKLQIPTRPHQSF